MKSAGSSQLTGAALAIGIIDAAVQEMEAIAPPAAAELFTGTRKTLSPRQAEQRKGR